MDFGVPRLRLSFPSVTEQFPFESFAALNNLAICRHVFTQRIPGIDVSHGKDEALNRLEVAHHQIRRSIGVGGWPLLMAEQIHGNKIAIVDQPLESNKELAGYDGFITKQRGIALAIHVADCCAVYIVDPKTPAIGLVHSGRKGTELNIVGSAVEQMAAQFGSGVTDLIVQLSPCIRPPHYEIDFAAEIIKQCRARGVRKIHDSGVCTACDLDQYYSYRAEKGKTGRMLALLALR